MPVIRPRLLKLFFALLIGAGVVAGCSVDRADMASSVCSGLACNGLPSQDGDLEIANGPEPPEDTGPPLPPAKETCGVGSCLPDNAAACATYTDPSLPSEGSGSADAGTGPDDDADAGIFGLDAGLDGGQSIPELDGSFTRPTQSTNAPSHYSCQISVTEASVVERSCGAAGTQSVDEACTSSRDCEPGLGCVGTVRSGRCLPFCCTIGADTCQDGYYCAERPLRDEMFGEARGPLVPVCDRADDCSLGEREDCEGPRCVCGPGTACSLVRPDGATACVTPGLGLANESCPCAAGYHCSQAATPPTCVKMCALDEEDSTTCGPGVCQATPVLPDGWGICVGVTPGQMTQP